MHIITLPASFGSKNTLIKKKLTFIKKIIYDSNKVLYFKQFSSISSTLIMFIKYALIMTQYYKVRFTSITYKNIQYYRDMLQERAYNVLFSIL